LVTASVTIRKTATSTAADSGGSRSIWIVTAVGVPAVSR